jgi:hypothetical protein
MTVPNLKIVWSFVNWSIWVFTLMLIQAASDSLAKNSPTCLLAVSIDCTPSVDRRRPMARLMRDTSAGNFRMVCCLDNIRFLGEGPGPPECVTTSGVEIGRLIATDSQEFVFGYFIQILSKLNKFFCHK